MMGSLKNKRYQATAEANWSAPKRHYAGCLAVCAVGILILLSVYSWLNQPAAIVIKPLPTVIATPIPVSTPSAPQRIVEVGKELIKVCTAISENCASVVLPSQHHTITTLEQAALDVVYPTTKPIAEGVDSACFWAKKYNVSCEDVKAATEQMMGGE